MSDSTTPAATGADFSTVRDFPDRVSPMVVKELRQGLRGRYFVATAIGFHSFLCIVMATSVQDEHGGGMLRFIWMMFAGVMVFLLPLRGLSVLADERTANTLDTLVLTNLTAGRILRGKWLAIAAQISLMAVSVMPYVILMYLASGTSLPLTLLALLRLWLLGLLMAAVNVSLSWNASWLTRTGLAMLGFILAIRGPLGGIFQDLGNTPGLESYIYSSAEFFWIVAAEFLTAAAAGFILLELAAGKIAPHENHSGPARLAVLLLLLCTLPMSLSDDARPALARMIPQAHGVLAAVCLFSLTEAATERPLSSPLKGVPRWLPFGRGWRQGMMFALPAWGLGISLCMVWSYPFEELPPRLAAWLFCGWLVMRVFPEAARLRPQTLIMVGLGFTILQVGVRLLGTLLNVEGGLESVAVWLPSPVNLAGNTVSEAPAYILAAGAAVLCLGVVLLDLMLSRFRKAPPLPSDSSPDAETAA